MECNVFASIHFNTVTSAAQNWIRRHRCEHSFCPTPGIRHVHDYWCYRMISTLYDNFEKNPSHMASGCVAFVFCEFLQLVFTFLLSFRLDTRVAQSCIASDVFILIYPYMNFWGKIWQLQNEHLPQVVPKIPYTVCYGYSNPNWKFTENVAEIHRKCPDVIGETDGTGFWHKTVFLSYTPRVKFMLQV